MITKESYVCTECETVWDVYFHPDNQGLTPNSRCPSCSSVGERTVPLREQIIELTTLVEVANSMASKAFAKAAECETRCKLLTKRVEGLEEALELAEGRVEVAGARLQKRVAELESHPMLNMNIKTMREAQAKVDQVMRKDSE